MTPTPEREALPTQELDALLDHIYEHGTTAEGVSERALRLCRAYAASPAAGGVQAPDGYVMVPQEPTPEMVAVGAVAARRYMEQTGGNSPAAIYRAMLAATPPAAPAQAQADALASQEGAAK